MKMLGFSFVCFRFRVCFRFQFRQYLIVCYINYKIYFLLRNVALEDVRAEDLADSRGDKPLLLRRAERAVLREVLGVDSISPGPAMRCASRFSVLR